MSELSSMKSGAASYSPATFRTRFHFDSSLQPALAQVVALDRRLAGDEALGELGLAHLEAEERHGRGRSRSSATFSAMFVTSADFPIDGRAAMMTRLPGWKPPVIVSRSEKPGGRPGEGAALGRERLPLGDLDVEDLADLLEVLLAVVVGDLEHDALGPLDELARLRLVAGDGGLDLVGRRRAGGAGASAP